MNKFTRLIPTFISGAVFGALIMLSTSTYAASTIEKITAYINSNFNMVIDGEKVKLENKPINYKNRNYLPVAEVAEIFNKELTWDEKSKTATFTSKIEEMPIIESRGNESLETINVDDLEIELQKLRDQLADVKRRLKPYEDYIQSLKDQPDIYSEETIQIAIANRKVIMDDYRNQIRVLEGRIADLEKLLE